MSGAFNNGVSGKKFNKSIFGACSLSVTGSLPSFVVTFVTTSSPCILHLSNILLKKPVTFLKGTSTPPTT